MEVSESFVNWVSKVIRYCFGSALLRFVIGGENLNHFLNQSNTKLKPIALIQFFLNLFFFVNSPINVALQVG